MITYRFEFRDGTTTRTRTFTAHTLGEAQALARKGFPRWKVLRIWEQKVIP